MASGLVLAWFLADSLSRPLRTLAATARRVEEGDLDARAEVTGATEQREVTIAFNDMTERIGTVLAAQREFVSNASHQLRTPLTGLRLRLESAAAKADSPELERELIAAEQEVDRLARLLNTLLMLAREGQTRVTGRLVSLGLASKHAHERWEGRSEQLGQRLRARAGRGRRRARGRGRPRDHARQPDRERAPLLARQEARSRSSSAATELDAYLAVLDDGPGLAPGEEQAVFERFKRGSASKSASGTGLGLAIVQTLAQRWGGRASLRTRPEGGRGPRSGFPPAMLYLLLTLTLGEPIGARS